MFILNEKPIAERTVPRLDADHEKRWEPSLAEIDRMIAEEDRRREKEDGRE